MFSETQGPPPGPGQQSAAPGVIRPAVTLPNGVTIPGGETTPAIFIEYWLYNWGPSCPTLPAWAIPQGSPATTTWIPDGSGDCWFNSPMQYVPPQTAGALAGLILTGTAGAQDTVVLATSMTTLAAAGFPSVLSLSQVWTEAEFNVFGDCCLTEANFTTPTVLVVQTSIDDGTMNPPTCVANDGTTGEKNNLTFVPTAMPVCCPYGSPSPAIEFMEADSNPHNAWCTLTTIEGDTHIVTADGTRTISRARESS